MPKLDGTGPLGEGPKTGRGLGKCNPDTKNNDSRRPRNGLGMKNRNRNR
ncbi:MAG TPA: DUF5320 domain-containing protein [Bacilli bacterium]|nr:DUF5320 domain-containing protein [Bacilli bacterium]